MDAIQVLAHGSDLSWASAIVYTPRASCPSRGIDLHGCRLNLPQLRVEVGSSTTHGIMAIHRGSAWEMFALPSPSALVVPPSECVDAVDKRGWPLTLLTLSLPLSSNGSTQATFDLVSSFFLISQSHLRRGWEQHHMLACPPALSVYAVPSTQASAPHPQCCAHANRADNIARDAVRPGSGSLRADRRRRQLSIDSPTGVFLRAQCHPNATRERPILGQLIYLWLVLTIGTMSTLHEQHWTPPLVHYSWAVGADDYSVVTFCRSERIVSIVNESAV